MAREFKLPDIGEGISEVELLQWYVQEGDHVREDQNLAEIETDKAVADLPSPYAGLVSRLHFKPGERIPVGATLVSYDAPEQPTVEPVSSAVPESAPRQPSGLEPSSAATDDTLPGQAVPPPRPERRAGEVLAAPATRRRARELGIELAAVQGSGPGGRVTNEDLERYAHDGQQAGTTAKAQRPEIDSALTAPGTPEQPPETPRLAPERTPLPDFTQWGTVERVRLTPTRRQIARKMVQSLSDRKSVV